MPEYRSIIRPPAIHIGQTIVVMQGIESLDGSWTWTAQKVTRGSDGGNLVPLGSWPYEPSIGEIITVILS